MVKKWSDLKLADEKELRRKRRERKRKERELKLKAKKRKEKFKLYVVFGGILFFIIAFSMWIYSSWKSKNKEEFLKYKKITVVKFSGKAKLLNSKGEWVDAKKGLQILAVAAATGKKSFIQFRGKGGYFFTLRENSKVKFDVLGITSLGKLKMKVEVLSGTVFVKCSDLSIFNLKVREIKVKNVKYCKFNLRVNVYSDKTELLCEYGTLEVFPPQGGKKDLTPMKKMILSRDKKVKMVPCYSFNYY